LIITIDQAIVGILRYIYCFFLNTNFAIEFNEKIFFSFER
jgi:hypothetical protein